MRIERQLRGEKKELEDLTAATTHTCDNMW